MSFTRKRKIAPLIVVLVFVLGMIIGTGMVRYSQADNETYDNLKTFSEVLSLVQKNYVEEVNPKELIYGAIKGMLADLDPHSSFMTPEKYKEMQVDTKGEFGGLGIQIGVKDRMLTVIAPIEDTPAYQGGDQGGRPDSQDRRRAHQGHDPDRGRGQDARAEGHAGHHHRHARRFRQAQGLHPRPRRHQDKERKVQDTGQRRSATSGVSQFQEKTERTWKRRSRTSTTRR